MKSTNTNIKILQSVDSTNNYAMQSIRSGLAKHGHAIAAYHQTKGKGQRGKFWLSNEGENITLSLIFKIKELKISQQFYFSMAVSNAVVNFLHKYTALNILIKWPNDLFYNDRKAGGILIENILNGHNWEWAVIGIGINVNQNEFSSNLPNAISLKKITGISYSIIEIIQELYNDVMKNLNSLNIDDCDKILKEYHFNLYKLNQMVTLKKDNVVLKTTIKAVSSTGQLICNDIIERSFNFGEVAWLF